MAVYFLCRHFKTSDDDFPPRCRLRLRGWYQHMALLRGSAQTVGRGLLPQPHQTHVSRSRANGRKEGTMFGLISSPPFSACEPVTEILHGVPVTDTYRWLEDQGSPRTRAWIEEQTLYAR